MYKTTIRRGILVLAAGVAVAASVGIGASASAAPVAAKPSNASAVSPASVADPAGHKIAGRTAPAKGHQRTTLSTMSDRDGVCDQLSSLYGDLCLWYFQNYTGSMADFYYADSNLNDNTFITSGDGQGRAVGNNAESAFNKDGNYAALTCTGTSGSGTCAWVYRNDGGNFLDEFKNNVESFTWG